MTLAAGLPECLQEKMREVERSEAQLELGDYAHAIGGLKIYRDAMELAAEYIGIVYIKILKSCN